MGEKKKNSHKSRNTCKYWQCFAIAQLVNRIFLYLYKFNLQKSTIMRKFRSQTDRLNVTANKNSYIYFRKIFKTWLTVVYADWWYSISFRWKMISVINIPLFFLLWHVYHRVILINVRINRSLRFIDWRINRLSLSGCVYFVCGGCVYGVLSGTAKMCGRQLVAACL